MPIVFRISDAIGGALFAERDRWLLWLPVFLGAGTGLYFGLAAEPLPWIGPSVLGLAILGLFSARRRHGLLPIAIAAAAMALGFTAAAWRTFDARHTILTRQIGPTSVTGQVSRAELFTDGARLTLERVRIAGLGPGATPERVRIRLRRKTQNILAGDWVRMRARIGPPPPPVMPGAFDFQRRLYFAGIGATGFAFGAAEKIASAGDGAGPAGLSLGQRWQQMRQRLSIRIRAVIGGDAGAVAAVLITGDRSAISKPVLQAFRDSGIAHLLAISGLYVGLVTGLLFFGLRAILALVPALALTYPIKKWAALFAIGGAFFYTMLAGATVPTQRAFVMIGLILIAVIFDRQGISMRLVAIAAFVILLIQPDAMLGPSFQMSFAAVIALIAAWEKWGREMASRTESNWRKRALLYLAGIAFTSVIATLATAPFAVHHFNRIAVLGLATNMLAVPNASLWIMPFAILGMLLMPLGLENLALGAMGWGIDAVIGIAQLVAAQEAAVIAVRAMPVAGLIALALGGLWLCLWRRKWRYLGTIGTGLGLASLLMVRQPDLLIDGRGRLFALLPEDGRIILSSRHRARFSKDIWLRRTGLTAADSHVIGRRSGANLDHPPSLTNPMCDRLGCIWRIKGQTVALITDSRAVAEDCRRADLVVSMEPLPWRCPSAHTVVDWFDLWRNGSHAIWLTKSGARVDSVNGVRGNRPWVQVRKNRRRRSDGPKQLKGAPGKEPGAPIK